MPKGKGPRHCAKCGEVGHYAKTCKRETGKQIEGETLPKYIGPLKPSGVVSDNGNTPDSKSVDEGSTPSRPATLADKINKALESVPSIVKNYTEAINKSKYPHLYAATERGMKLKEEELEGWKQVAELRRDGKDKRADNLAAKLLGVESEPMSEEAKEKLRIYNEEHKEEIAQRRKEKKEQEAQFKEAFERQSKKVRIRRKK